MEQNRGKLNRCVTKRLLYYVHDPMCSWCWAFRPTWQAINHQLPSYGVVVRQVLGGLAPDTEQPMPESMQVKIKSIWRTIQTQVPGTEFNYDFWHTCHPRRSTYPACRGIIAATNQGGNYENAMILAIQEAYYLYAKNPSDDSILIELAEALGLDILRFKRDLNASETKNSLLSQIKLSQQINALGFPSLILDDGTSCRMISYDYNDPTVVLNQLAVFV